MRKWFWLYLTFSAGTMANLGLISLFMISHMANRTPPDFSGGRAYLLYVLAPFLLSQGANYAGRRIEKIVAEGVEGFDGTEGDKKAVVDMPWWYRTLERVKKVFFILALMLIFSALALTWKQYFAS